MSLGNRSKELQRLEAHRPLVVKGGVDSRVRMTMTTEEEVDDIRGTQDMGVGSKRKEDPSSSNPGNKQKTSISQGHPGRGLGHQDQGQEGTISQARKMMCYFFRQPGHFRRDFPRRLRSQGCGTSQPQPSVG